MKKTYIIPTTDEIVLKACGQLLAGSGDAPTLDGGDFESSDPVLAPELIFFED